MRDRRGQLLDYQSTKERSGRIPPRYMPSPAGSGFQALDPLRQVPFPLVVSESYVVVAGRHESSVSVDDGQHQRGDQQVNRPPEG